MNAQLVRYAFLAAGIVYAALTVGFVLRMPVVVALWPWPDTRLSFIFVGSICGALATGALWVGWTGNLNAAIGSLIGLVCVYGLVGTYLLVLAASGRDDILPHAAIALATAAAAIILLAFAARYLSWRACHALDTQSPGADELAIQAKIYGSEAAVRVITDLMRVVGIESYDHEAPFGRLLQDALALPIFDGGNMGIRRRQLHAMLLRPDYDPLHDGANDSRRARSLSTIRRGLAPVAIRGRSSGQAQPPVRCRAGPVCGLHRRAAAGGRRTALTAGRDRRGRGPQGRGVRPDEEGGRHAEGRRRVHDFVGKEART